jgi:aspartate kinase
MPVLETTPARSASRWTRDARGVLAIKFGGTSVATPARIRRAACRVRALRSRGWQPVVVVSAAGATTDRLLRHVADVSRGARAGAAGEGAYAPEREIDRALATGEDRSAALLAVALCALGVPAVSVRAHEGVLRAEGAHGAATLSALEPGAIARALASGIVPVVSGFQGERRDGELVTLGRGSSDTTAVFLAAALGAAECHIVTDVDGVYDADPRLVPDARFLPRLSAAALVRLCEGGARVVHPEAARRAHAAGIPLRVYHFRSPIGAAGGTCVRTCVRETVGGIA